MDKSYQELLQEREALDAQIAQARKEAIEAAIAQVRSIVAEFDLTERDVFRGSTASSKPKAKVPPKYRDPATGKTWSGRGKPPTWIANKDRAQFAIEQVV